MTENCTLLKLVLRDKYIRFGAGNPSDKEITNPIVSVNRISTDILDYIPYAVDSDFSILVPHDLNSYKDDPVALQDIWYIFWIFGPEG